MAKSIKLGSDTFLDASGVHGIKGTITSGDLNNYIQDYHSGLWYLGAAQTAVTNAPAGYCMLIIVAKNGTCFQICVSKWTMFYRGYTGAPATWSPWHQVTATQVT